MRKFRIVKMILFAAVAVVGLSYIVMLLWNGLIPDLFKGPLISFPQALGLLILSKILFHGFGHRGGHHWKHQQWRERMQQKMNDMTPDERERFREQWKKRCGRFGGWGEHNAPLTEPKASD